MPFNVANCSINSLSSLQNGDDSVSNNLIDSTYNLTITPDAGYAISYDDFSIIGACSGGGGSNFWYENFGSCSGVFPNGVDSIGFVQNVNNVIVIINLDSAFAMNNANQIIDLCIDGSASSLLAPPSGNRVFSSQAPINQNVTASTNVTTFTKKLAMDGSETVYDSFDVKSIENKGVKYQSFDTPALEGITYSKGEIIRIFSQKFGANNGYFSQAPYAILKSRDKERYIISSNSVFDNTGRVTSKTFTIDYKVPQDNVLPINTGDKIDFYYDIKPKFKENE